MANRLGVVDVHAIETLLTRGWSQRRIARELGVHRETVGRYARLLREKSKPAKVTPGIEGFEASKPAKVTPGSGAAIRMGFTVLYRSIFDLVREFLRDEALGGEEKTLACYLKPDLLIVDDMGMKQLPKRSGEYLFEIIMRRHENRSTIMTSNRPIEEWGKLIGDVPAATAILDRVLHHAQIISAKGKSYRLRKKTCRNMQEK